MKKFPVVEIFGPTIQGEGALAGVPSHFIRFGGCDYRCVWCDSKHAVLPEEVRKAERLTTEEIVTRVAALGGRPEWLTLSGGNPALLELDDLVGDLQQREFRVAIETQGTRAQDWMRFLNLVTVSPKGPSSGNVTDPETLRAFLIKLGGPLQPRTVLKVVIFNWEDYSYAKTIHERFPQYDFFLSVGTYSGGLDGTWLRINDLPDDAQTLTARYRRLAERVANDPGFSDVVVLPQLHYLMWKSEKGR